MKVRLTKYVESLDRFGNIAGLMVTKKRNKNWVSPKVVEGKVVECEEPQFYYIPWNPGTEMEVSDATGAKLIERNQAVEVKTETEAAS